MALRLTLLMLLLLTGSSLTDHTESPTHEPQAIARDSGDCTARIKFDNNTYEELDLRPLRGKRLTVNGSDDALKEIYTWSVCQQANFTTNGQCLNQQFVYERIGSDTVTPDCKNLGDVYEFRVPNHILTLHVYNLHDAHQSTDIRLVCGSEEALLECDISEDVLGCTLGKDAKFVLKSKYACLSTDSPERATPILPPGERNWLRLSPGSIVLIAAGSVFVTYMIIGLAHGTGKGEKGLNRLPNSDFWLELPLLVRDGVKYTFGCKFGYAPLHTEDKHVPIADV